MYKYLVLGFLLLPALSFSQDKLTFQQADSLSYSYFQKGEWEKLKIFMQKVFKKEIDSKFMRQLERFDPGQSGLLRRLIK